MAVAAGPAREGLLAGLRARVGEAGVLDAQALSGRGAGASRPGALTGKALVRPRTTEEVAAVLAFCAGLGQVVVPQGGRTGLVNGADAGPEELILSLERLDRIEAIDPVARTATVGAGVILQSLQAAAADHGLCFGVDHGARASATIGGAIATNAGGNRVIRYGMTRASVLGLEAVLADGTIISSMSAMLKNNTGYDLKQLFIGSEGTLGVVTRAVVRLQPLPSRLATAMVACQDFQQVTALLGAVDRHLGAGLLAFEVMWNDYYRLALAATGSAAPLSSGVPFAVLLEVDVGPQQTAADDFESWFMSLIEGDVAANATVAQSEAQRMAFWRIRDSVEAMKAYEPVHHFDVSLPIVAMAAYVQQVREAVRARWSQSCCWVFGHVGDGNLHVSVATRSMSPGKAGVHDAADSDAVKAAVESIVYAPLADCGGVVSAEHGIGTARRHWLASSRTPAELALMRQLKACLDPGNRLNPGRVI